MANDANLSRSAGVISIASAASRVTGLLNILVIAYAFGKLDYLQDSYNLANVMPNMLFELIAGGILTSLLIPVLVERILEGKEKSWHLASNITNITVGFLIIVAFFGTIFSYYLVRLQTFLVSTQAVHVDDVNFFFKFFIWEIVFYGLTAIFNGILQANRSFAAPAYAPIFNNIVVVATVVFLFIPINKTNPHLALIVLAAGTMAGIAAMALVQIPALLRIGWRYHPVIDFKDPAIRKLGILALPVVIYVVSNQVGLTVSNALAWQFEGGITSFMYSWRFFQMPYGLLAVSISTVLFPRLSEHSVLEEMSGFKRTLKLAVTATAFIMIPVSVYFSLLSEPIISLFTFFFGPRGVSQVASVMSLFMVGLLPFSLFMLLNRVFYALNDTRTPMKVNALGVPLNIGLNFILVGYLGVAGLSLGHSLTYLFTMSLMFMALRRRIGSLDGLSILKTVSVFALISIPVGVIIVLLTVWLGAYNWPLITIGGKAAIETGNIVLLIASGILGSAVYIGANAAVGTDEVRFIRALVPGLGAGEKKRIKEA